jgi:hypothetical protein
MSLFGEDARRDITDTITRAIEHEPEADEILRQAVVAVYEWAAGVRSVGIAFVEAGRLVPGPVAGEPFAEEEPTSLAVPVTFEGHVVAELWVSGTEPGDDDDSAFGTRLAALLSPYCLVGWDTGGEAWEP